MRIVIDMQGAQTESRFRGIGRYTQSFAQAIVRNRRGHEVILALSGLFPETIEPIRAAFDGLLPPENIRVWYAPGPVREMGLGNGYRREAAELVREAFLASLNPDVIHVSSLFEGYIDDAVTSIGRFDTVTPVSVSLYDLIPLLNPKHYLEPDSAYKEYYLRKVSHLQRATILLAISDFSRREALKHLNVSPIQCVNVSSATEPCFQPLRIDDDTAMRLRGKFGVTRQFVLYAGGADERKNLPRLIQAFARLPGNLRDRYQLLLAGKISDSDLTQLRREAKSVGLRPDELCFSGYITDEELVQLNNLCDLFVFPSWHEGFGLPALEAMSCGAPVIGSNTSSLPEVIGLDTALFDPMDVAGISAKMALVLEDSALRSRLRDHGFQQAKLFSWDASAQRAISAFESMVKSDLLQFDPSVKNIRRPRLAFVSPLPPERTGIADYSADLLPALEEYYDVEIVVAQDQVVGQGAKRTGRIRSVDWLRENTNDIDRVLYHVGNSPFHAHMLPLIREIPGAVVLHDFYLSGLLAWLELHGGYSGVWTESLYNSHGYIAVCERFRNVEGAKDKYPANFDIIGNAKGLIAHSVYSKGLAHKWYGKCGNANFQIIPLLRRPVGVGEGGSSRSDLGIGADDFVVCSFGFIDSTKLNHRLLGAWLRSSLARDASCKLFFVGENQGGEYGAGLLEMIRASGIAERVKITGFATPNEFRRYLASANLAVQLRTSSRGETSAAVLDCMNYGLPVVVNANGSMAELDSGAVWMLPDDFEDSALIEALETLRRDADRRSVMGRRGRQVIRSLHAPAACAARYVETIEQFYSSDMHSRSALIRSIAAQDFSQCDDIEVVELAKCVSLSFPGPRPAKRLFLDVSATCRSSLKTGIERVARALVLAMLDIETEGYRIEPVYLIESNGGFLYRYAREYTLSLLDCDARVLKDDVVEPESGDILLTLDLSGDLLVRAERADLFGSLRRRGVKVYSTVFDLLPLRMPEVFPPGADVAHQQWLQAVMNFDGAMCISKAVADDISAWMGEVGAEVMPRRSFTVRWFHLGADFGNSAPTRGLPDNAELTLKELRARTSFLMVGTVEPRKGYLEALEAFDQIWSEGGDVNLVIVGKEGWLGLPDALRRTVPETVAQLRGHSEAGKRLFWLEGISDEYLDEIYAASACLIAASYGEGFGLPIIEAAKHGLSIIARDIAVFREVAGNHAYYFGGATKKSLATTILEWTNADAEPRSAALRDMACSSWARSAGDLLQLLLDDSVRS